MSEKYTNRVLSTAQMTYCEHKSDELGVSLKELMDNAASALSAHIEAICKEKKLSKILILTGKGNNGGDGLVAANLLAERGFDVQIMLCCGEPTTDLARAARERLKDDIVVYEYNDSAEMKAIITQAEVLVDCIFGTGFKGEIRKNMNILFEILNLSSAYKIACDIPSGANAQSGQASTLTFPADMTVTFHAKKIGMTISPAKEMCGKIFVEDIKIPNEVYDDMPAELSDIITENADLPPAKLLPARPSYGHKGTFGKLVSVCGSGSYIGAAVISAHSALRTGVGIVNLCTAPEVISAAACTIPECTFSAMKCDESGFLTGENADTILEKLSGAQCLLLGCGLGHTAETEKLVKELVEKSPVPIVLDADGINSLCPNIDVLLKKKSTVILTPHPAELARLCGVPTAEIMSDRLKYASEFSKKYGVIVAAKGAQTLVCSGGRVMINSTGCTALAKGGSGDMLAGIISSLTAQSPETPADNAWLGCYIMGKTAEMLSEENSERGILATDIIKALPKFLKKLEQEKEQ